METKMQKMGTRMQKNNYLSQIREQQDTNNRIELILTIK